MLFLFLSKKIISISVLSVVLAFAIWPIFIFAQDPVMEQKCLLLTQTGCQSKDDNQCRKELEECAQYYNAESQRVSQDLSKTDQEKKTLQSKVYNLNSKIKDLTYRINKSNLIIKDLKLQMEDTTDSIVKTTQKIAESKENLANILQIIYEEDQKPLVEVLLSEADLSTFFDNMISLEILNSEHSEILNNIINLKRSLEEQSGILDFEKEDLEKTVKIHEQEKNEQAEVKKEQQYYLNITESQYQKQLAEKQDIDKKAAEIRAKLFQLAGTTKAPTFGEAIEIAKSVGNNVGIRPALLLAIISQESAIGRNVGQCVLTDPETGYGKRITNGQSVSRLMKVSRDIQPFLEITSKLGKDPYNTPVSCPLSYGYGGAMGPAQFIASTWNAYAGTIERVLGRPGNPWAIVDSFTASAIYLYDLGAHYQTYSTESRAASRYYGGSSSYAKGVMTRAECIQDFMDVGDMSSYCQRLVF